MWTRLADTFEENQVRLWSAMLQILLSARNPSKAGTDKSFRASCDQWKQRANFSLATQDAPHWHLSTSRSRLGLKCCADLPPQSSDRGADKRQPFGSGSSKDVNPKRSESEPINQHRPFSTCARVNWGIQALTLPPCARTALRSCNTTLLRQKLSYR